jgi:cytoskeletal protein RodZ
MNFETAGVRLKKIRQERGISLEEIQKKTKIHPNVLRAIEGDSITDLSPIYLKGFIKIYCNSLGLDPKEFLGQPAQPTKPVLNAAVGKGIGERLEKKPMLPRNFSFKLRAIRPSARSKKIILIAVITVISVLLVSKLFKAVSAWRRDLSLKQSARSSSVHPKSIRGDELLPKEAINRSSAKNIPKQAKVRKEFAQGFTVGIFARDKSWISAKVDGKVVFHGMLARGRTETWQAKEKIELSLGDAGAVELQVNDQRFSKLGRRGQSLKNIIINKEGLKISR